MEHRDTLIVILSNWVAKHSRFKKSWSKAAPYKSERLPYSGALICGAALTGLGLNTKANAAARAVQEKQRLAEHHDDIDAMLQVPQLVTQSFPDSRHPKERIASALMQQRFHADQALKYMMGTTFE